MRRLVITNARIAGKTGLIDRGYVAVEAGRIMAIAEGSVAAGEHVSGALLVDAHGDLLVPGFIDQHIHGFDGADATDDTDEAIGVIARGVVRHGVTSICPTTMAAPAGRMRNLLTRMAAFRPLEGAANVLGINLEGPFLSPAARGSHDLSRAKPSPAALEAYHRAADGRLKLVTVAPELPGACETIARARALGIVASIGHTRASADAVDRAVAHGASCVTHLFNAMPLFHHRQPGALARALLESRLMLEVIADGHLVHDDAVRLAIAAAGTERVILISDSLRPAGRGSRRPFSMGKRTVYVRDSGCVLRDGREWGSTLDLSSALRRVRELGCDTVESLIEMTSGNAARLLGLSGKGTIEVGADADLVTLGVSWDVTRTIVMGELVHVAA